MVLKTVYSIKDKFVKECEILNKNNTDETTCNAVNCFKMAIRSNCLAFSRGSGRFHDRFSGDWSQLLPDPAHRGSPGGLLSLSLINRYVQVVTTGQILCFEVKFSITCIQTFYFLKFFFSSRPKDFKAVVFIWK